MRALPRRFGLGSVLVGALLVASGCGSSAEPAQTASARIDPAPESNPISESSSNSAPVVSSQIVPTPPRRAATSPFQVDADATARSAKVAHDSKAARELRERRLALPDALETFTSLGSPATATPSTVVNSSTRMAARALPVPGERGLFEVALNNTGTGWQEKFLLFLPSVAPGARVPMLVVFHKFGVSHWDAYYNTTFLKEARTRGWVLVAPLGASGVNFGSVESQINTRAVLDLVAELYPIDRNRVYGVGFSMGGGGLVSYAARNLDPQRVMFAAICDHTGGVSLSHTYFNETDDNDADDNIPVFGANLEVPDILDYWFQGPPWVYSFNYQRCQGIEIDPFSGQVVANTDMARNLKHIPTLVWLANDDPFTLMVTQTMDFYSHIQSFNPANLLTLASSNFHWWASIDEALVCNYLAQFTLQIPTGGSSMADEDGVFFRFQIEQDAPFHLTPFTWSVNTVQNQFNLNQTANLRRVSVNLLDLGLHYTQTLKVNLFTADGTGDQILLRELVAAPSALMRDGQAMPITYDPQVRTLLIQESDPNFHQWIVVP